MVKTKENKKDYIGSIKVKHKWVWITSLIVFLLGWALVECLNIYVNVLNVSEIDSKYLSIYVKDTKLSILCYIAAFIVSMIFFSLNTFVIKRNLLKWEETAVFLKSKTTFLALTGILSLFTTYSLPSGIAHSVLMATNPTWFVHADPVFGKNIGYYVFQRPLFTAIANWVFFLMAVMLIYTLVVYFMYYARNGAGGIKEITKQPQLIRHAAAIILLLYVLSGLSSSFFSEYSMLNNTLTESSGGYTDIMVWSNFYKFIPFLLCLIIILSVIFMIKKDTKHMLYSMLIYPAIWLLVAIYAFGVQTFYVNPNKATIERPYIKHRIESTLRAYGLDNVNETTYPLTGTVSTEAVAENTSHIENLIISDEENALLMLNSLPSDNQVYLFKNADLVPSYSGKMLTAKYTSAREVFIPDENKTLNEYNNRKMRYTHGFGLGSVTACAPESADLNLLQPAPLSQPRIYFGESDKEFKKDYIITGTDIGEYDMTDKTGDVVYSYDGPAGVNLTPFNRIVYAFRYQDPAIALSGNINENSKILFNRNVIERAKIAIPFLTYDENPYLVETSDGRLVWILDGYTSTDSFPYAAKLYDLNEYNGTTYIRNSVKLTVDAYTGDINAYIIDWDDPIIRTLNKIYPGVFLSTSLPPEIASHLKYPQKLFEMQSEIYKTYHDSNPSTFYTKDGAWEYAMSKSGENATVKNLTPYYQFIDTADSGRKLVLISPFTPAGKSENLTALFTVSSDINSYGELTLYTFPRNANIFGTMQTENRIESDKTVTAELETLKSEGSIVFGPLTTLPIMDTICYIKPVYVNSGSLTLKRVIVVCGESVAIDINLPSAFRRLAEMNPKSDYSFYTIKVQEETPVHTQAEYNELVISALDKYNEAKQFSVEGDWVNYGKTMEEFERLLDEIRYDLLYPEEGLDETE